MGCVKKLGCLVVLVALIAGGAVWYVRGRPSGAGGGNRASSAPVETWQPLTADGAKVAEAALRRLASPSGPAYANVLPGDLASYILQELARSLPKSADSIRAAAIGDRLYVRAVVRTSELGGSGSLGPLSALLGERERVQMGGTLRIIRPGLAELQVKEFKIREFAVPRSVIPRLIRQISRGERPAGLSPDGIPLKTPLYIGDVRVANGVITMYKTAQ